MAFAFVSISQLIWGELKFDFKTVFPHLRNTWKPNKKAELTPGLARDRTATWRFTVNLAS